MHFNTITSARNPKFVLAILAAALLPQQAIANAGTPLVWATMLHLLVGNALIGIGEGWLVAKLAGLQRRPCILIMIFANYLSAWLGGGCLIALLRAHVAIDLDNFQEVHAGAIAVAYFATVLMEWPFIWWAVRARKWPGWKSFLANLLVQSVSYAVMLAWYGMVSATSLLDVAIVPAMEMKLPRGVEVYYFDAPGGTLRARGLDATSSRAIPGAISSDEGDRLIARESDVAGRWDIVVIRDRDPKATKDLAVVVPGIPLAAVPLDAANTKASDPLPGNWFNFGPAMHLATTKDSPWEFRSGFWSVEGLRVKNLQSGLTRRVALETPIAEWQVRNLVALPGDLVLFQLGRDQICIYDPATNRIALLWKGYGVLPVTPTGAGLSP